MMRAAFLTAMWIVTSACSAPPPQASADPAAFPTGELVDLSHTYDKTTIFWPTAAPFALETVSAGMTPGGYYYAANNFSTSEHGGTHLDAPVHFAEGKSTVDQVALNRLVGPAVVIDVTSQSDANADYLITVADIEAAEKQDGPIPANAIVLLREPGSPAAGPTPRSISARPSAVNRPSPNCISQACIPTRPDGSSPTAPSARLASTRRASTTDSQPSTNRIARCLRVRFRRSRT